MLRELNTNEMENVSGGSDLPPDGFGGLQWEWDWAQRDPLVMEQMLGGAGNEGSGGFYGGGSLTLGLGVNAYSSGSGENDSGLGGATVGLGYSITIGQSDNTDDAVTDVQNDPQVCLGLCANPAPGGVTLGVGVQIPLSAIPGAPDVNGGKSK
ncbi:hypothetical protein [Hellea balneolensis]|uniref:hypothetical protein n=1 Tax=Hellea balneolensis TaxID=287478 RepID=UPI00047E3288|nr:hypothetical protein [Hellea balneolensis]